MPNPEQTVSSPPAFTRVFISNDVYIQYLSAARKTIGAISEQEEKIYSNACANHVPGKNELPEDPMGKNLQWYADCIKDNNIIGIALYTRFKSMYLDAIRASEQSKEALLQSISSEFFGADFLDELTRVGMARALKEHNPFLLTRPGMMAIKEPLLNDETTCNRLFSEYLSYIEHTTVEVKASGTNLQQRFEQMWKSSSENILESAKVWCAGEGKTLTQYFDSIPNLPNQFQLLATNGDPESTAGRAAYVGFAREWKTLSGQSSREAITPEEKADAIKVVKYIQANYPFALVTGEDHIALITLLKESYSDQTLQSIAKEPFAYFNLELASVARENSAVASQLSNKSKQLDERLQALQTHNLNCYKLYITLRGGEEAFIHTAKSKAVEEISRILVIKEGEKQAIQNALHEAGTPEQIWSNIANALKSPAPLQGNVRQKIESLQKHHTYLKALSDVQKGEKFALPLLLETPKSEKEVAGVAKPEKGGVFGLLTRGSSSRRSLATPGADESPNGKKKKDKKTKKEEGYRQSLFTRSLRRGSHDEGTPQELVPATSIPNIMPVLPPKAEVSPAPERKYTTYASLSFLQKQYVKSSPSVEVLASLSSESSSDSPGINTSQETKKSPEVPRLKSDGAAQLGYTNISAIPKPTITQQATPPQTEAAKGETVFIVPMEAKKFEKKSPETPHLYLPAPPQKKAAFNQNVHTQLPDFSKKTPIPAQQATPPSIIAPIPGSAKAPAPTLPPRSGDWQKAVALKKMPAPGSTPFPGDF